MEHLYKNESELYTIIGQLIIDSLKASSIIKWDVAVLHAAHENGISNFRLERQYESIIQDISLLNADLHSLIKRLKAFTSSNNYTPWNRFEFKIFPDYKFNMNYRWDEKLHNDYLLLLSPRWK